MPEHCCQDSGQLQLQLSLRIPCNGRLSPAHHLPPQLQAEPELSCHIPNPISHTPIVPEDNGMSALLHAHSWSWQQPGHRMLVLPGTGRGLGTQSRALQGTQEEAATSASAREAPGRISHPRVAFQCALPSLPGPQPGCGGGCQQGKPIAFRVDLFLSIQTQDARAQRGQPGCLRLPLLHPVPLGDVTPTQAMCRS